MEEKFNVILDEDERIIEIQKPNKLKFFTVSVLGTILSWAFVLFFVLMGMFVPDEENPEVLDAVYAIIPVGIFVLLTLITLLFCGLNYKNLYYAYTNKRIIIRSGIFGVDFKSLDMNMIGAINVDVSVVDKILRKNTGTITFGSMASPMGGQNGGYVFAFRGIVEPYENYKKIKAYIDEFKKSQKEKIL